MAQNERGAIKKPAQFRGFILMNKIQIAIIGVVVLGALALLMGHNGQLMMALAGLIGLLAGVGLPKPKWLTK